MTSRSWFGGGAPRELASTGLTIKSAAGNLTVPSPPTVLAEDARQPFDLILLSCKAYDLDGAIAAFAPAVGPNTAILPLLNGMRHLDVLDARFGRERVLGGQCYIAATLDQNRAIVHLNNDHELSFGERDGGRSARIEAISATMAGALFKPRVSEQIVQEMWEKWVFLATLAGSTCLMRAASATSWRRRAARSSCSPCSRSAAPWRKPISISRARTSLIGIVPR